MAQITAQMVKELRESTGAGMMDCKNALNETQGDMEAAIDWLRKKGLSKAAKKAGRVAAEGLVAVAIDGTKGIIVEVNSETDFVARNPEFQDMALGIAKVALTTGDNVEAIRAAAYPGGGTVDEKIAATVAKIGENMTLRRASAVSVSAGAIGSYIHNQAVEGAGKIGVIVALESTGNAAELAILGRQIAMHVAAANPLSLDPTGLDADVIAREKAIMAEKHQGKPANVVEKILESSLKTYYKEVCLLEQSYIHDGGKTVSQALKEAEGKVGAPIALKGYVRFGLGEGIEKQESDFAAEVAAAASGQL